LVLVIIVVIALSLLYQFNATFKNYAGMLFDGYYRCLMETGELPGSGTQCAAEFGNFDMKSGKQLVNENAGFGKGGGWGSGDGSGSDKESGKDGDRGKGGEKTGGKRGGRNAVTGYGGSGGRTGRFKTAPVGKLASTAGEVGSSSSESAGQNMTPVRSVGYVNNRRRSRALSMSYFVTGDAEQKRTEARPASASMAVSNNEGSALRPSKRVYTPPRAPAEASDTGNEGGFTFGKLIRTLIIVILIVAIVVFFGGQLMQISRSGEKGGQE
jgi:hypothetical protein